MKFFAAVVTNSGTEAELVAVDDEGVLVDGAGVKHPRYQLSYLGRRLQEQVRKFEEYLYEHGRVSEVLTYWNVTPETCGGQVVKLVTSRKLHSGLWCDEELADWQYELLKLDPQNLGCVEPHPEGSDRGGYVPTLTDGTHYDEGGGCWQG